MSTLDLPSKKLFIQEIKEHYKKTNQSQHPVSVWIQGTVVENNDNFSQHLIDDGTGLIQVLGNDKIPNCPKVKKGQYVMITGIVLDVETTPILRAIKVQDLTTNCIMETMWILEVIDQTLTCSS